MQYTAYILTFVLWEILRLIIRDLELKTWLNLSEFELFDLHNLLCNFSTLQSEPLKQTMTHLLRH